MRLFLRTAVGVTLLAVARPATTQQPAARDTASLRPVVVTATRVPVDPAEAPVSVTVLAGDDLRARGIAHVAEALAAVPGLAVVRSGSFGATTALFARGGESDYVKVLVDGVAVNNPGGAFDFASLTTDNVERIEVVRGPASVVYGSDAVAGVIQIFTRRGSGPVRASAGVRGGSFGALEGAADVGGGIGRLGYSLGAAARHTDGVLAFNNAYGMRAGSARLTLSPAAGTGIDLTARATDATYHFPTDGVGRVVDSNAVRREERAIVGIGVSRRLTPRIDLQLLAGAATVDAASSNLPDSPGDTAEFYGEDDARIGRRSADLRADLRPSAGTTVSVGAEVLRQEMRSTSSSRFMQFPPTRESFRAHRSNHALYAQAIGVAGTALGYTMSARVDRNGAFGTFVTARASASWHAARGTTVRAAIGNAFKEPAFEETFSSAFTIGNPDLEPERTVSWEASVEHRVAAGRGALTATYFDQRFRDLIQFLVGDVRGTNENLAAATARGLEVEARAPALGRFGLGASVTALRTRVSDAGTGAFGTFVEGERLLRRPSRAATVDLSFRVDRATRVAAVFRWVGERDDRDFANDSRVTLSPYSVLDVSGDLSLAALARRLRAVSVTARIENLFDREYEPAFNFPAPGRTVLVGVRVGT